MVDGGAEQDDTECFSGPSVPSGCVSRAADENAQDHDAPTVAGRSFCSAAVPPKGAYASNLVHTHNTAPLAT